MKRVKLNEGQLRRLVREMMENAGPRFGVRFAGMGAAQARSEAEDLKFRLARAADVDPSRWSWAEGPPSDDGAAGYRGGWMLVADLDAESATMARRYVRSHAAALKKAGALGPDGRIEVAG